jgi:hypothetical protein
MTSRKSAVSIRLSSSDIGSVKKLARRLGARDSDVIRCAIKMMMSKMGPLADATVRGRSLVPVFVESGADLFRHFELDAVRLENIINEGVPEESQVDHDDIQLIAMNGIQRSYVKLRLSAIGNGHNSNGHASNNHGFNGNGNGNSNSNSNSNGNGGSALGVGSNGHNGHSESSAANDYAEHQDDSLRHYLYDKYVYRHNGNGFHSAQKGIES